MLPGGRALPVADVPRYPERMRLTPQPKSPRKGARGCGTVSGLSSRTPPTRRKCGCRRCGCPRCGCRRCGCRRCILRPNARRARKASERGHAQQPGKRRAGERPERDGERLLLPGKAADRPDQKEAAKPRKGRRRPWPAGRGFLPATAPPPTVARRAGRME
jgi:hypothetical protein